MINSQLFDYVRQQLAVGVTKEQLQKTLASQGWNEQDVDEVFTTLEKNSITPVPPTTSPILPVKKDTLKPSIFKRFIFWLITFVVIYIAILLLGVLGAYLNTSGLPSKSFVASYLLNAVIIFQPFTALGLLSFLVAPLFIAAVLSFIFRAISKHSASSANQITQWPKWLLFIGGVAIIFTIYNFLWNTFIGLLFLDSPQIVSLYQSEVRSWGLAILAILVCYIAAIVFYKFGKYKWSLGISVVLLTVGIVYLVYAGVNAKAQWVTDQKSLRASEIALSTPVVIASYACPNGNVITVYDPATRGQYGVFDPYKLYEYSFVRDASGEIVSTTTSELGQVSDGYTLTQPLSATTQNELNTCKFTYGTRAGGEGKTFSDMFVPAGQTIFDNRPNSVTVGIHLVYPSNLGQVDAPSASESFLTLSFRDAPNLKMIIALDDTLGSSQTFQKWIEKNYGYIPSKIHNPQITDDASLASFTTIAGHEALKVSNYTNDPNHSLYLLNLGSGSVLIFAIQGALLDDKIRDQIVNSVQY